MKKLNRSQKAVVVVAAGALGVAGSGIAYAYWTASGTGTGSASATGYSEGITVYQTSPVSNLYPNGPAQTLSGNFANANPGNAYVASVTAVVSSVTNAQANAAKPACATTDYSIGGTAPVNQDLAPTTAPAGRTGSWTGLTVQLVNTAANQDNCKTASAVITYTANAS